MNLLFLTLIDIDSLEQMNIYTDLLREFVRNNHKVYVVSPLERRKKQKTYLKKENSVTILRLKTGNIQKTGILEKGISTITIEQIYIHGIKNYFKNIKFDLVLYSTPPITFYKAIDYVKKRDNAKTYLLLKDIFPQNAVDIGIMKTSGAGGIIYRFFRNKEKKLYGISDRIGCMSQANVDYIIKHNPEIDPLTVEICPNSIEIIDKSVNQENRIRIRKKYDIPLDRKVFVYGGNLGKPQGIDFLVKCLRVQCNNKNIFFLIVGDGTEYEKLEAFTRGYPQGNIKLMKSIPKEDYDILVGACDIGMIFLDHRFTIPNFPSRLLSYMQAKIPVLACTDVNTDIGKVIVEGGFGWWCESRDVSGFDRIIKHILVTDISIVKENAFRQLKECFDVKKSYQCIIQII